MLLRQRPSTAKGITFVTLEDETGTMNLVLHQRVWERFYTIARRSPAWIAEGRLESRQSILHVIVSRLEDLAAPSTPSESSFSRFSLTAPYWTPMGDAGSPSDRPGCFRLAQLPDSPAGNGPRILPYSNGFPRVPWRITPCVVGYPRH